MPQVAEIQHPIERGDWAPAGDGWISDLAPIQAVLVLKIPPVVDPEQHRGHVVRFSLEKDEAGGAPLSFVAELLQDYVDEETQGRLIDRWTTERVPSAKTVEGHVLPNDVAEKITDYGVLALRLVANQEAGSEG